MTDREFDKLICEHIETYITIKDLAAKYGVTASLVLGRMRRKGIKTNTSCMTPCKGWKHCSICKMIHKESEFNKGQTRCKVCNTVLMAEYRKNNPDKMRDFEARRKGTDARLISHLKADLMRHYGITPQDRVDLMDKQKGCCAICEKSLINPAFRKHDLHVDHDHTTGKIRGLLCSNCNTALGGFKDDKVLLDKASSYLEI